MYNLIVGFAARVHLYATLMKDVNLTVSIIKARLLIVESIASGGKVLIFGNGGSAAEAQHFAAELVCQFEKKRRALPAIALTTDSSVLTAWSNDFSFASVFERQIEALCRPEDVVIGLTTSDAGPNGHSNNLLNAFLAARKKGAKTVGFFSIKTTTLLKHVDVALIIPHENTAFIQEVHLAIIHMLCGEIEKSL